MVNKIKSWFKREEGVLTHNERVAQAQERASGALNMFDLAAQELDEANRELHNIREELDAEMKRLQKLYNDAADEIDSNFKIQQKLYEFIPRPTKPKQ